MPDNDEITKLFEQVRDALKPHYVPDGLFTTIVHNSAIPALDRLQKLLAEREARIGEMVKQVEEAKWRDDREAKVHKEWLEKELSKALAKIKELEKRPKAPEGA